MSDYETITKELDAGIPENAVQYRPKTNKYSPQEFYQLPREKQREEGLSYLSGYYVIDRLNKIVGAGNWAYTADVSKLHEGTISGRYGETHSVHYSAKVRLVVTIGDKPTEFTDYGYGDGSDKSNPGKAHELAIKEAVTDGLKRTAKNLGQSFGLALYDKEQKNVIHEEKEVQNGPKANPSVVAKGNQLEGVSGELKAAVSAAKDRATTNKLISATSKVIVDKGVRTPEQVVAMVSAYGVKSKEELTDEQAAKLLSQLKAVLE